MAVPERPVATYRLQFNRDFTFRDATRLIPYLQQLGISHCYASPYLRARAGSRHGYDIVDHNAFNPEIGSRDDFLRFVEALRAHGMGHILDLVPNHMGVGGDDNAWWLDVLENGESSPYAHFFDIDWLPIKRQLRHRLLVPILGDHYGSVLESGQIRLKLDPAQGELSATYFEHRFPLDPKSYPDVLGTERERLRERLADQEELQAEFEALLTAFDHLPDHWETEAARRQERQRDKEVHKRRLASLLADSPALATFVAERVAAFNGEPGDTASFNAMNDLLDRQPYHLAYWQVALDEINYRRFFDINDLAGLRMEDPEVFASTHRMVLELMGEGLLDGLRIDHPDGLYDPLAYYRRLNRESARVLGLPEEPDRPPRYLVVEKILASYETLPEWPVDGTTGYEFANLVTGLFIDGDAEKRIDSVYHRFLGSRHEFEQVLYESKKLVERVQLSSELTMLANMLNSIAQTNRYTRDYTLNGCRDAIAEVVACFPVYRTYINEAGPSAEDQRYVEWAVTQAKKRSPAADVTIFDFIRTLMLEGVSHHYPGWRQAALKFTMKLQQYTSPAMAKSFEDTALYVYNRLVSLNEVGGDPTRFGISPAALHRANQERARRWPHAMLTTSTHDTKRSEDVRARINVLSEVPDTWEKHLERWSRLNRSKKSLVNDTPAPSRNDEYLLYQVLVGAWPLETLDEAGTAEFCERVCDYMIKAVKESKVHTSWVNPNEAYETGVRNFVQALLCGGGTQNPFLMDFLPFQAYVRRYGLINALGQVVLKLASPGMPDIYQGNEIWDFSLVDPDNRRPVDYARRKALLEALARESAAAGEALDAFALSLFRSIEDGRAKLWTTWRLLQRRRLHPALFEGGEYHPLSSEGRHAGHLCAFARSLDDAGCLAAVPRLLAKLHAEQHEPLGEKIWADTAIDTPWAERPLRNVLTGERVVPVPGDNGPVLRAAELFRSFPVAFLEPEA